MPGSTVMQKKLTSFEESCLFSFLLFMAQMNLHILSNMNHKIHKIFHHLVKPVLFTVMNRTRRKRNRGRGVAANPVLYYLTLKFRTNFIK